MLSLSLSFCRTKWTWCQAVVFGVLWMNISLNLRLLLVAGKEEIWELTAFLNMLSTSPAFSPTFIHFCWFWSHLRLQNVNWGAPLLFSSAGLAFSFPWACWVSFLPLSHMLSGFQIFVMSSYEFVFKTAATTKPFIFVLVRFGEGLELPHWPFTVSFSCLLSLDLGVPQGAVLRLPFYLYLLLLWS